MRTAPPSMRSRPARQRSSVVLPQPDGPSRTMNSPSRMSRSTSLRATVFPKVLRTDSKATLAISSAPRSPQVEEIAAHEEDEEERRDDEEEAAGESEVERRDVERAEHLSRKRCVADREDRRGEDLVPRGHEGEDRGGREAGQGQGERDADECAEARRAERRRGLLELARDTQEHARGHDDDERQDHRGVDDDHGL